MPLWQSKQTVWSQAGAQAMLTANKTLPGAALIAPASVGLFKNDVTPTPQTLIGDLTPADFSGYALTLSFLFPTHNFGPDKCIMQIFQDFVATTATPFVPGTVYGWYVTNAAGDTLYASERFTNPLSVQAVGDFIGIYGLLILNYIQTL